MFPYTLKVGGGGRSHRFLIRVPIDDEHTWYVRYAAQVPADGTMAPVQESIPLDVTPLYDEKGRLVSQDVTGQDQMTWVAQGPRMDRTRENLGRHGRRPSSSSRKLMDEQIKIVEDGGDPINTFRDPEQNRILLLPNESAPFPGFDEPGGPWAGVTPRTPDLEVSLR